MVAPTAGEIVLVPFPFSNLSQSKVRAIVRLVDAAVKRHAKKISSLLSLSVILQKSEQRVNGLLRS